MPRPRLFEASHRPAARLAWGAAALLAFRWLRLRRRRQPGAEPPGDPAAELRRALDESRTHQAAPEPPPAPEPADLDLRRREVHERGRAAIERMRPPEHPAD